MSSKLPKRIWRIRNIQPGVILLPWPPVSHPTMEILPINGTVIIDHDLLETLGDLVEIVEEVSPPQIGCVDRPDTSVLCSSYQERNLLTCLTHLFQIWNDTFGTTFKKTSELLFLADQANLEIIDPGKPQHQRVSELGKMLRRLAALDNSPWVIRTRFRSNRTEYSIDLIQLATHQFGQNP